MWIQLDGQMSAFYSFRALTLCSKRAYECRRWSEYMNILYFYMCRIMQSTQTPAQPALQPVLASSSRSLPPKPTAVWYLRVIYWEEVKVRDAVYYFCCLCVCVQSTAGQKYKPLDMTLCLASQQLKVIGLSCAEKRRSMEITEGLSCKTRCKKKSLHVI